VAGHWAEPFITPLADRNWVQGFPDGSFQPDRAVSRGEYATLLMRAFRPVAQKAVPALSDVPEDFWAREAIVGAIAGGFLAGSKSLRFQPHQPVLRFQVLLSLVSGLGLKGVMPGEPVHWLHRFADLAELPPYAQKAVAVALEQRLIVVPSGVPGGVPGTDADPLHLALNQPATRGEVTAMIYQGLVYQQRVNPLISRAIVYP